MLPTPLAILVRERRERLGITQSSLADAAGTSRETVKDIEYGRRVRLPDEVLQGFARKLNYQASGLQEAVKRSLEFLKSFTTPFAKFLREARLAKGWSQEELSQKTGIEQNILSAFELSRKLPPVESVVLETLAKAFQVEPYTLRNQVRLSQSILSQPRRPRPVPRPMNRWDLRSRLLKRNQESRGRANQRAD